MREKVLFNINEDTVKKKLILIEQKVALRCLRILLQLYWVFAIVVTFYFKVF